MQPKLRLCKRPNFPNQLLWELDNTAIGLAQSCVRKFDIKHRLRRAGPRSSALGFGSAVHTALAAYNILSFQGRRSEFSEWFAEHYASIFAKSMFGIQVWDGDHRTVDNFYNLVNAYTHEYNFEHPEFVKQADDSPLIEVPFEVQLSEIRLPHNATVRIEEYDQRGKLLNTKEQSLPYDTPITVLLIGKIDSVLYINSQICVEDYKTASAVFTTAQREYELSPQFKTYCYAFYKITGLVPSMFRVRTLVCTKTGKASFQSFPYILTHDWLNHWQQQTTSFCETLLYALTKFDNPAHANFNSCTGKYGACEFFSACQFADAETRSAIINSPQYNDYTWDPRADD